MASPWPADLSNGYTGFSSSCSSELTNLSTEAPSDVGSSARPALRPLLYATERPMRDPAARVHWDEECIAEHDKDRGTRQKIDEPDTPFVRSPTGPLVQGPFALCFGSCRAACAFQAIHIASMGFNYLYLVALLLVSRPAAVRPSTAGDNDEDTNEDANGVDDSTIDMTTEPKVTQGEVPNHGNLNGKRSPPHINHHIWDILKDYPSLVQDLHQHPRCLEVLALAIESNAIGNETVMNKKDHGPQDRLDQQLMDEIERHRQCSSLLFGILVKPDPSGIRDLFKVHPEGFLLVQAFCFGLLTYFILSHVIRYWANHVASNVKDSLACLNDPAPPAPWALSWIFACCQPKSSGHDPGSCDGDNLKSAWKGLEESQQRYLRSVMHKARSLQVAGIAEQRVSGMWKMIEMGAAALTPIFISIEGMFGSKFSQPLKVVAILLSLVTTVCQVAPKNQATSILDYHARLRKLVFAYWSLTTIFNVYEENENQRPSMDTPAFEAQRASVFSSFVMALSKEVQDAENELKDVFTTTRLTKDQVPVPLYGPPNQGSSGDGTNAPASTTPAGADATEPRPAEARQGN